MNIKNIEKKKRRRKPKADPQKFRYMFRLNDRDYKRLLAKSMNDFRLLLKKKNIGVVFRQNEAGRIYGVTFIDYPNRTVLNGSRLGKEFSANVFNDLFNNLNRQATESKQDIIVNEPKWTEHIQNTNSGSALGSLFGILDMNPSGNDYEEENFIRGQERKRKKKPQKKRGRGI